MKRFFLISVTLLLTFSLVRALNGVGPLTFSKLLSSFSELNLSFKNTKAIVGYMQSLTMDIDIDSFVDIFKAFLGYLKATFCMPVLLIAVIIDIGALLGSFFKILVELLGFDPFGDGELKIGGTYLGGAGSGGNFGDWSGGGHGGGGSGVR